MTAVVPVVALAWQSLDWLCCALCAGLRMDSRIADGRGFVDRQCKYLCSCRVVRWQDYVVHYSDAGDERLGVSRIVLQKEQHAVV